MSHSPRDDAEARRLRAADLAQADDWTREAAPYDPGAPAFVGKTTSDGTYPTTAAVFYAVNPVTVSGTETAGSAASFSASTAVVHALNLGTAVPASGTYVLVTFAANRWVFRYDG